MRSLLLLPITALVAACAVTADDDARVQTKVGLHPSEICDNGPNECENGDNGGGGSADPVCGDGRCNGTETCGSCPADCGICTCGDGKCDEAENCASCAKDCGNCPPPTADDPPKDFSMGEDPKAQVDLVPIISDDLCPRVLGDNLVVKIKNAGQQDSAATTTRVVFSMANGVVNLATAPIAAGATRTLITQMPEDCIDAQRNCSFSILADADLSVVESNESNNYAPAICNVPK
jgi:hypothetical protein